ncbi:hypothetical protein BCR34DRAFT_572216 [Clohesyomyces aquaticus]|uniref:Secreted protein n=1 Tax=Clohesyomyces aquaticus TaxID=1231657 RepID=A0A1Y1Z4Y6_9PLEO|nr:hypothetical protein BCR34DRAFT_572216 [Clohesyomyces aquaticus]
MSLSRGCCCRPASMWAWLTTICVGVGGECLDVVEVATRVPYHIISLPSSASHGTGRCSREPRFPAFPNFRLDRLQSLEAEAGETGRGMHRPDGAARHNHGRIPWQQVTSCKVGTSRGQEH